MLNELSSVETYYLLIPVKEITIFGQPATYYKETVADRPERHNCEYIEHGDRCTASSLAIFGRLRKQNSKFALGCIFRTSKKHD